MPSKTIRILLEDIKPASLKRQRIDALTALGDLLDWNKLAIDDVKTEHASERIRSELIQMITRQNKSIKELQLDLAIVLADSIRDKTLVALNEEFHTAAKKRYSELTRIESAPSSGGRKRNETIWKIAKAAYEEWESIKGCAPSGNKLSSLVEAKMIELLGHGRKNGNLYLAPRSATEIIKQLRETTKKPAETN
jgi:hypothetical protein